MRRTLKRKPDAMMSQVSQDEHGGIRPRGLVTLTPSPTERRRLLGRTISKHRLSLPWPRNKKESIFGQLGRSHGKLTSEAEGFLSFLLALIKFYSWLILVGSPAKAH